MTTSPLTPDVLQRIRLSAQNATPGPWYAGVAREHFDAFEINIANRRYYVGSNGGDAHYIALLNPKTALSLVAEIERLRAENARLKSAQAWKPIEEAPKDRVIIGYCPDDAVFIQLVHFHSYRDQSWWGYVDENLMTQGFTADPTHWMELPTKPDEKVLEATS